MGDEREAAPVLGELSPLRGPKRESERWLWCCTCDAATAESSRGVLALFCAGSLSPAVLSLFMLGGFAVRQEVNQLLV